MEHLHDTSLRIILLKCDRSLVGVGFGFPQACPNEDVAGGETLNRRLQLGLEVRRLGSIEEVGHRSSLPHSEIGFQRVVG
jgi:hypothetical protein